MSADNTCEFSLDRRYRFTLEHRWDFLSEPRRVMWIGLNPSTADEKQLDPTLRRVRSFSDRWGFNTFVMTNLFAFRATKPLDMMREADPVGTENDKTLLSTSDRCDMIVAAWGGHGTHLERAAWVTEMFKRYGKRLHCLDLTQAGAPKHPLYVKGDTLPKLYAAPEAKEVAS